MPDGRRGDVSGARLSADRKSLSTALYLDMIDWFQRTHPRLARAIEGKFGA